MINMRDDGEVPDVALLSQTGSPPAASVDYCSCMRLIHQSAPLGYR